MNPGACGDGSDCGAGGVLGSGATRLELSEGSGGFLPSPPSSFTSFMEPFGAEAFCLLMIAASGTSRLSFSAGAELHTLNIGFGGAFVPSPTTSVSPNSTSTAISTEKGLRPETLLSWMWDP